MTMSKIWLICISIVIALACALGFIGLGPAVLFQSGMRSEFNKAAQEMANGPLDSPTANGQKYADDFEVKASAVKGADYISVAVTLKNVGSLSFSQLILD